MSDYAELQQFVGAVSDENGTSFQYEKRRQKGAVYNVYAAEDIVTAGGKTVYKKGAEVAHILQYLQALSHAPSSAPRFPDRSACTDASRGLQWPDVL